MDAKTASLLILFSGPCTPPTTGSGGEFPTPPPTPTLAECPDDYWEGRAYAETLRMEGDHVTSIVEFVGCADDTLRLCTVGEPGDGDPRVIDLAVDYREGTEECGRERARTLRSHAYDLRLDAFNDEVEEIEFWLHGLNVTYRM